MPTSVVWAQDPYSYSIDRTTGLPSNTIYDIFQDHQGWMWFATSEGLCKYDGTKFKMYQTNQQTSKSGSNIVEDSYNRIWYINFDGYLYYVENNILKSFPTKNSIGYYEFGILNNYLFTIEDDFICIYNIQKLQLLRKIPFSKANFKATHLAKDGFYVFSDSLLKIDSDLKVTKSALPKALQETKSIIVQSDAKTLYLISKIDGKIYQYKNTSFSWLGTSSGSIIQNIHIVDQTLWLSTTNGLKTFKKNQTKSYFNQYNISGIFKDREHKYWISTLNNGLLYVPNFSTLLWKTKYKPISLLSDKNKLIIGYENDILSALELPNYQEKILYKGKTNHEVYKIYQDKNRYLITSNNFKSIDNTVTEINLAVKDLIKIDAKYYAIAASGLCGLFTMDSALKSSWDSICNRHKNQQAANFKGGVFLKDIRGKAATYNPINQTIYFGTNTGLFLQNKHHLQELQQEKQKIFPQKLFYYDTKVYLFTNENKIFSINQKNQLQQIQLPDNIAVAEIKNIKMLEEKIFVFTVNAIYQYDVKTRKTNKVQIITPDISVSDIATLPDQTVLATSEGLILKPNSIGKEDSLPKFFIHQALVNDKPLRQNILEYDENNVHFDFSVLAYLPNSKYPISYQINRGNWIELEENQRSLTLSSLASGDYNLNFRIENVEKTEQKTIAFHFTIQKPFWLQWYFLILYGLAFIGLVYILYRYQIRKIQQKNAIAWNKINLENNLNQSKLTAIKSQMNPHFFYNALNTIQSYILSNDKKEAISYLNKFSSLTRTILELTEKNEITLEEELKTIILYLDLEKARFNTDFEYHITVDLNIPTETTRIPTMLLQPFIENAIKHGLMHLKGNKILQININKIDHDIHISITDNGIGRKKSAERNQLHRTNHNSFATNAIANRLEILNKNKQAKITIEYIDNYNLEESIGTTVLLKIPNVCK